jgi:Actin like proteins N terminal domain
MHVQKKIIQMSCSACPLIQEQQSTQKGRILMNTPIYYAGFDPGSGKAALQVVSADGIDLSTDIRTTASTIADVNPDALLNRGDVNATLASVLHDGECLIKWRGFDYALGDLVKQGRNLRDEMGNPNRYWGDHARILLLALASQLVPERAFALRLVTALPVTLYNRENRGRMKSALSGLYRFEYNGCPHEVEVFVGYVAMEGQGILIHCGQEEGEQAVMDIGERTLDCIAADGQKLLTNLCGGCELGIGQMTDAVKAVGKRYGRVLLTTQVHTILSAYAQKLPLPVIRANTTVIPETEIVEAISKSTANLAKRVVSFVGSLWNVEGEAVGARFERITLGGGGAYYLGERLASALPQIVVPADPEYANIRGYTDLALTLSEKVPTIWEQD